eukprot:3527359-Prorocentrum_lima.AAC.1
MQGRTTTPFMLGEKRKRAIQDNISVNIPSKALHPDVPLPAVVVHPPSLPHPVVECEHHCP